MLKKKLPTLQDEIFSSLSEQGIVSLNNIEKKIYTLKTTWGSSCLCIHFLGHYYYQAPRLLSMANILEFNYPPIFVENVAFNSYYMHMPVGYNVDRLPNHINIQSQNEIYRGLLRKKIEYMSLSENNTGILICRSQDLLKHINEDYLIVSKSEFPKYMVVGCNFCVRDLLFTRLGDDCYLPWNSPFTVKEFLQRHDLFTSYSPNLVKLFKNEVWESK